MIRLDMNGRVERYAKNLREVSIKRRVRLDPWNLLGRARKKNLRVSIRWLNGDSGKAPLLLVLDAIGSRTLWPQLPYRIL